jgi:type VI secretion system protein VasG
LPDKAVSVLDTACARIALGLTTTPPEIEDAIRRIGELDREAGILERESVIGRDHRERMKKIREDRILIEVELKALEVRWQKELEIAARITKLQKEIRSVHEADPGDTTLPEMQEALKALEMEFSEAQGDTPLVQVEVTSQTISRVISGWTGIPIGRMQTDGIGAVLNLRGLLGEKIIGQGEALGAITQMVQAAHAGLGDPSKPTAVLLFAGPSGVGKTETALALSELLYGGADKVITINMSEYQEAHTVSSLKGSPPGYIGYGEGGVLTEAVRKRPYSVVLLDEVEKAHPDVMEMFFQVFDKGTLEDGEGRRIDFKNTLIILTTNLGSDIIEKYCTVKDVRPDGLSLNEIIRPELLKHFKAAFLGRMKVVPYYPISDSDMRVIAKLKLEQIVKRMRENRNIVFSYNNGLIENIAARCTEVASGARNIDHILTNTLLPEMSRELLARMGTGEQVKEIRARLDGQKLVFGIA